MIELTITKLVSCDSRLIASIWNEGNKGIFYLFGMKYVCFNFTLSDGEMVAYIANANEYDKKIKELDNEHINNNT